MTCEAVSIDKNTNKDKLNVVQLGDDMACTLDVDVPMTISHSHDVI